MSIVRNIAAIALLLTASSAAPAQLIVLPHPALWNYKLDGEPTQRRYWYAPNTGLIKTEYAGGVLALKQFKLGGVAASHQVEVAPPPHPTLAHIAKEYERYKMPLPKPNWRLVETQIHSLAFRDPAGRGENQISGTSTSHEDEPGTPIDAAEVAKRLKNDPTFMADVWQRVELTCLAVQCRHTGLKELADALYTRSVELHRLPRPAFQLGKGLGFAGGPPESVELGLRNTAFGYWSWQITRPGRDRRAALEAFRIIDTDHADTRDLELTLKPSTAAPGSVESLIDQLVEYRVDIDFQDRREFPAAKRLAEFGFDAVPALFEHWNDRRFTRHIVSEAVSPFFPGPTRQVRVGEVCAGILNGLLGFGNGDSGDALKSYGQALLVGEARWLAERSLPTRRWGHWSDFENGDDPVDLGDQNRVALRALASRYPERIAPIYQTILYKRSDQESALLAELIGTSRLARDEKVKLLEEGARHRELRHRVPAVGAMKSADDRVFRKYLLAGLKSLGSGEDPITKGSGEYVPGRRFAEFIPLTDDRECWDAFFSATKRASPSMRYLHVAVARRMEGPQPSNEPRYETLRFLKRFLADDADGAYTTIGDLAAWQILAMTNAIQSEFPEAWRAVQSFLPCPRDSRCGAGDETPR